MRHRHVPAVATLAALLALGLAAAGPVHAQAPPEDVPPLVEEISVEVVNVDVVVTDADGRPVTGLGADDFVVLEDGERREISNFFSFRMGDMHMDDEAAATESDNPWPQGRMRRRMAFLFDNNTLEKRDRQRAIEQLERFVLEQFDGTYEWAVVAFDDELQLMQPFTSDKTTVLGALGKVSELPIPVRRRRAADRSMLEEIPVSAASDFRRRSRRGIDAVIQNLTLRDFELRERMLHSLQTFDHTAAAIVQTVRAHMGAEGRKSLVLVSGALQSLPGGPQLLGRGLPTAGTGDEQSDQMIAVLHSELLRRYKVIIRMANAAGFSIYPISADALMEAHSSYLDVDRSPTMAYSASFSSSGSEIDVESASRTMAEGTGGTFYSTSNFYRAFDDIDDRTANSYVLGFRTDHSAEGEYHRIEVRTKRDGLRLFHRNGYVHLTPEQQIAEELTTPLAFPKDRGDFQVKTEIFLPEEAEQGRKKVTMTVAGLIPVRDITLVPRQEKMVGRVHLFVALYDPEGELVNLFRDRQDVQVDAEKMAAASDDAPARFGLQLEDLPRGDYTVTVTLVDDVTNRYGTGLATLNL